MDAGRACIGPEATQMQPQVEQGPLIGFLGVEDRPAYLTDQRI
jgi:hypothetical protein